jgi:3-dehydroquinate dehydratase-2
VKIAILHGPNLDRLGKREPEIYGRATLKDLEKLIRTEAGRLGFSTVFFQSAHDGALIDRIHALTDRGVDAFIVNFGAYSHTSIALYDALKASGLPAVEEHISDIKKREPEIHDRGCLRGNGLGPGFPRVTSRRCGGSRINRRSPDVVETLGSLKSDFASQGSSFVIGARQATRSDDALRRCRCRASGRCAWSRACPPPF